MYSSKVRHADNNAAELLYWNLTVAHSQARTFWFLKKTIIYYVHVPLETKLWIIDSFNNTYENDCRPNRSLVDKGKNTILKKEHNIE